VQLAIGRSERRINVAAFVLAALLLDVVLWLFVLIGWESVDPSTFGATHQPEFIFPFARSAASLVVRGVGRGGVCRLLASGGIEAFCRHPGRRGGVLCIGCSMHWCTRQNSHCRCRFALIGAPPERHALALAVRRLLLAASCCFYPARRCREPAQDRVRGLCLWCSRSRWPA
jgi:hypothetical protein